MKRWLTPGSIHKIGGWYPIGQSGLNVVDVHGIVHSAQHGCDLAGKLVSEKQVKVNV